MNLSTILLGLGVLALLAAIVLRGVRRRKRGQGGCSCGCSNCALQNNCHSPKTP